ncbi:MAG: cation:proton antiporter [Lachnospiraceae bacterium]|jgi:Kef-type K+ transport system membrane component KefB|nr:cation:proton antiporter [Lachnospiraceae bacterium]
MEWNTLTYLAVCLFLCLIAGKIVKQVKLPNVTGYIIMGLLAGPYCLKIVPKDVVEGMSLISEVALGFIAFSIGAEFKLSYLKRVGKAPIIIAFTEALGAVFVVDLILVVTGNDVPFSLCLGAIAAATAPAATLMVVRQYKAKGPVTETLLPVVAIDDAVALMAFGLSVAVAKAIESHGQVNILNTILDPAVEIFGALLFGAVLGVIFRFLVKWYTGRGNRLAVTIAMVFICVGISDLVGFSSLLACMAMSCILVNTSQESDMIFSQLDRMTPPVFMLFFFISGAELDLTILPQVGIVGVLYVLFRIAGKWLGAWFGGKVSKAAPVVQKYLGYTLIPQAGVAIGLASVAMAAVPHHGAKIRAIILCGTIVYELIGPVVTKLALRKAGEIS